MEKANIRINCQPAILPTNWRAGFNGRYQVGCGGKETPYIENGQWKLLVWDSVKNRHLIYNYSSDVFETSPTQNPELK